MSVKPLLWLACGLAVAGCAAQQPGLPSASSSAEVQPIPQAQLADIRAGNFQQAQREQRQQNVINTIRYLGVGGLN